MKNSTLSRKPGHDMKPNASCVTPVRGVSQSGDGESFAFNGQMGDGVNRAKTSAYAGNQLNLNMRERYSRGPTVGNQSSSGAERNIGPSATRDPHQMPDATAKGSR
tara:strand:- start:6935 stop:7252 length:318 start_codon:yes stop_codon:yes gene_type:complete